MSNDLFTRVEQALEGMVEGVFSRAFRAPLQPIEIAKRLAREMEQRRTVSVNTTYVPNLYTVFLAPETHESLAALGSQVIAELTHFLRDLAIERAYSTVGPIVIRFAADDTLKAHDLRVEAASEAPTTAPATPATNMEHTMVVSARPTALERASTTGAATRIPLCDGLTLGRGPANAVVLSNPGASRQHAEIIERNGAWIIRDLGSTNGTLINTLRTPEHTLRVGDTLQLGEETLTVV